MRSDFHKRLGIELPDKDAELSFVNRVHNIIFDEFRLSLVESRVGIGSLERLVALYMGKKYLGHKRIHFYCEEDFHENLRIIEAIYRGLDDQYHAALEKRIKAVLALSEIDPGIEWKDGRFLPKGAELLDKQPVKDVLDWLGDEKYKTVREPFDRSIYSACYVGTSLGLDS